MKNLFKKSKINVLFIIEGVILLLCIANLFREKQEVYIESEKQQINAGTHDAARGNYIDSQAGYGGIFSLSPCISLPAGSYQIRLEYDTDTNMLNGCSVQESTGAKGWLLANTVNLYAGLHETDFIIWLLRGNDTIQVYTNYNGTDGYLAVKGISVRETNDFRLMLLTVFTLVFILADVIYIYRKQVQSEKVSEDNRKIVIALILMIILSSIPLMVNYVLAGDDLAYHLLRLEGLKDGLEAGQFPVRLYPKWLAGHGYADSVMYGNLLLYVPAVFRLLGLPLQTCYKLYVLLINAGTCLTAYYSYGRLFKNKYFGLLGSLLTLFAPYRLYCVYQRAAVGEYSAMMFLPLLCWGLYRVFSEDPETDGYQRNCSAEGRKLYFGIVTTTALLGGLWYENDCLENKAFWRIYDINGVGTTFAMGEEYLPVGTDSVLLRYNPPIGSEHVEIEDYAKDNLHVELRCTNSSKETGYVEVPLILYKGYRARDAVTGEAFEITYGDNNVIRVLVPADYTGTIQISFPGMWYWRLAEAISLAAAMVLLLTKGRKPRCSRSQAGPEY